MGDMHKRLRSRNPSAAIRSLRKAIWLKQAQFTPHNPRVRRGLSVT